MKKIEEICGKAIPYEVDWDRDKTAMRLTFEAGVLEMHCAYAQRTDGMFSDGEIRELLTKKL